jgi:hypothetical protein
MAATSSELWKKAKALDFTIQHESWGSYEVDDDVVVRARTVLLQLLKIPGESGQPTQYAPSAAVLVAVDAPFKIRRAPTDPPPSPDKVQATDKAEAQFRALDEPWNEYIFDDSGPKLIRIKLVVSGITRVLGLYDGLGAPIFQLSHATVVAPPVPRKVNPGK